jgi:hypothetical protein
MKRSARRHVVRFTEAHLKKPFQASAWGQRV